MLDFMVDRDACVQCGECVRVCVRGILVMANDGPQVVPGKEEHCIGCQQCLAVCQPGAVSVMGRDPAQSHPIRKAFPTPEAELTLIQGRRSVRYYKKDPVSPEDITTLLDAMFHAPTAANRRSGGFTVVDDPAVMESVRVASRTRVANLIKITGLPEDFAGYEAPFVGWSEEHDTVFRGAPHMVIATYHKDNHYGPVDGGISGLIDTMISLSYFELLAQTMGIGTVWCGLAKLVFNVLAPEMPKLMGIPDDQRIGYVMLFGKPDISYHRTVQRLPMPVNTVAML
ncbi:nitroreductase family protein [Desulfovibrio inopinatus]|uniref:nitroreductase family protein n=1 Tax=Desulfovibrio inopinatus TaxID=102109 RepID=UPI00041C34A1|nr:nitroreductase family protein [Desulfovibrio inopinatus]